MVSATTLDQVLSGLAREGALFERLPGGGPRCNAGGCLIPRRLGICTVRRSEDGRLGANRA